MTTASVFIEDAFKKIFLKPEVSVCVPDSAMLILLSLYVWCFAVDELIQTVD